VESTPHLSPLPLSEGERRKGQAHYNAVEWMLKPASQVESEQI
jgi:hypothetical protein